MAEKGLRRISLRLDEDLAREVKDYHRQTKNRSLSETLRELIRAGLEVRRAQAAPDAKRALHEAMREIFPNWNGVTTPIFSNPVKLTLPSGKNPLSLLIERRKGRP